MRRIEHLQTQVQTKDEQIEAKANFILQLHAELQMKNERIQMEDQQMQAGID